MILEGTMAIPKSMQAKYDEIMAYIDPFCDEYLNDEYRDLCVHALEKLCRKRPSPLLSGRANTWAAGIVYAIAQNNWVFDRHSKVSMTAAQLAEPFGVAKSTASNKASQIRKMLRIDHFNAEWVLASDIDKNSPLWWVEVDGIIVDARDLPLEMQVVCYERGYIPYVPALRDQEQ